MSRSAAGDGTSLNGDLYATENLKLAKRGLPELRGTVVGYEGTKPNRYRTRCFERQALAKGEVVSLRSAVNARCCAE